jgi:hypothetical protein
LKGAVGTVDMALGELLQIQAVDFDEQRKAAKVSNPLVVPCREEGHSRSSLPDRCGPERREAALGVVALS